MQVAFASPCACASLNVHSNASHVTKIAVAGATGGVGRLLCAQLVERGVHITALARNAPRARNVLPAAVHIFELEHLESDEGNALDGIDALALCVGTTAFPTRAWARGNTPRAVDVDFVRRLTNAAEKYSSSLRKIVLLSSIGTSRGAQFPFSILNLFGVLDAKREGEHIVRSMAKKCAIQYAIIRPGNLVGQPHTNIGSISLREDPAMEQVLLRTGDVGTGQLSRRAAADALAATLLWKGTDNLEFSIVQQKGKRPSHDEWERRLYQVAVGKSENAVCA